MKTLNRKIYFVFLVAGLLAPMQTWAGDGEVLSLKTKSGQSFKVYVNGPNDAKRGILLVHGWFGLNKQPKSWADKFAALGYRAMAIDLYNGKVATKPEQAKVYMKGVKQAEADGKFRTALQTLQVPGRKLATLGWSFGGTQTLHATLAAPEQVSATVMYYPFGGLAKTSKRLGSIKGPVLLIRAKKDAPKVIKDTDLFVVAARKAGVSIHEQTYQAMHGFTNAASKRYDAQATEAAWQQTTKFLDDKFK